MKTTQMEDTSLQLCIILFCFPLLVNAAEFGFQPNSALEFGAEYNNHPDEYCKDTRCRRDGPTIRFPFWLKDQQPEHCRYAGFELSCTDDNHTMLKLPHSGKLYINYINYTGQRIDLYDPDACNDPRLVPILTSSSFEFYDRQMYNYTFFNCSGAHKDSYWDMVIRIPCLSRTHNYQIVALESDRPAIHVPQSCRKMYDSEPVPFSWKYDNHHDQNYISLLWNNPNCGRCYANDQKCTRMGNTLETTCLDNISTSFRRSHIRISYYLLLALLWMIY